MRIATGTMCPPNDLHHNYMLSTRRSSFGVGRKSLQNITLWFLDDLVENDKGITIGSSFADVQAAYGMDGYDRATNAFTLYKGQSAMKIRIENNMVTDIFYNATFE